jgi:hypothetical protein
MLSILSIQDLPGSQLPSENKADAEDQSRNDFGSMQAVSLTGIGYFRDEIIEVLAGWF